MGRIARFLILILLTNFAVAGAAAEQRIVKITRLSQAVESEPLDFAGKTLRSVVNAWEIAAADPLPASWTRLSAARGVSIPLSQTVHFLCLEAGDKEARILVVDDAGPHEIRAETGKELTAGILRVIYLSSGDGGGDFLIRTTVDHPVLTPKKPAFPTALRITGDFNRRELLLETDNPRLMDFAMRYLDELRAGKEVQAAARAAFDAVPPAARKQSGYAAPGRQDVYTDPRNLLDDPAGDPVSVLVTIRVVRGDSASIASLSSSLSYNSAGRPDSSPAVSAQSGPAGGQVAIGSPGDAFQARLRALEASGRVHTESETMLSVGFDDSADFTIAGPRGGAQASVFAERRGREGVALDIRQRGGDWSFIGRVDSRVLLRNGQTRLVAGNTTSTQSSQSSGVPILQDVPYAGPLFGAESRTSSTSSYALYVSAEFQ